MILLFAYPPNPFPSGRGRKLAKFGVFGGICPRKHQISPSDSRSLGGGLGWGDFDHFQAQSYRGFTHALFPVFPMVWR
jgi:hypothetical protein